MSEKSSDRPAATPLTRRNVFVGAGTVGALAAAAAVLPRSEPAQAEPTPVAAPQAEGYRLTEHVQRYYQTARV